MRAIMGLIVLTTIPIASLYWWNHIDNQMRVFDITDGELNLFPSNIIATTFIFVTDDCPISNRYAPEVQRLTKYFQPLGIDFHLVYVKPNISKEEIKKHKEQFFSEMTSVLHDPFHDLVNFSEAIVTPQAAIFDERKNLVYSGRIDDRYIDFGKQRPKVQKSDLEDALLNVMSNNLPNPKQTTAVGCYIRDLRR